jgi:hypothetical protein
MFWVRLFAVLLIVVLVGPARPQSSGNFQQGQTLGAAQLNGAFASKTDYPLILSGDVTLSGNIITITTPGIDKNILNTQTSNYSIATTDCGKTIQAGTGSTGLFTITLPSVSGFFPTCKVTIANGDTGRGKALSGFPAPLGSILWPRQAATVEIVNGAWVVENAPGRYPLPSATTVFVDVGSGSDSNDCLAATTGACASLQKAWDNAANFFDLQNNILTISIANGSYATGLTTGRGILGSGLVGSVVIQGNCGSPSSVNFSTALANIAVFEFGNGLSAYVTATIKCLQLSNSGANGRGIRAWGGGTSIAFDNLIFGTVGQEHIGSFHNAIVSDLAGSYTISGNGTYHYLVETGGQIYLDSTAVTCTGSPAFSGEFALASDTSNLMSASVTFTSCGTATGTRYLAVRNANIFTAGGGATFFPGNAGGTTTTGGQYN